MHLTCLGICCDPVFAREMRKTSEIEQIPKLPTARRSLFVAAGDDIEAIANHGLIRRRNPEIKLTPAIRPQAICPHD